MRVRYRRRGDCGCTIFVGNAVPPGEVRRRRARHTLELRWYCFATRRVAVIDTGFVVVDLYPAIDLIGGRCVRLVEGDYATETVYDDDPVRVAAGFAALGARWIHVVDLDAARTGDPVNRRVVAEIASTVAPDGVSVQAGGGVRSVEDAAELLDSGVARVVVGTAAIEDPTLVRRIASRWPGRVAMGLDHRAGEVRLRGWTERSGRRLEDLVGPAIEGGAAALIVTDIARDGRMAGPDLVGLASVIQMTRAAGNQGACCVIASGGVGSIDDVAALVALDGLGGIIAGKAIYEGRLDVGGALTLLSSKEAR